MMDAELEWTSEFNHFPRPTPLPPNPVISGNQRRNRRPEKMTGEDGKIDDPTMDDEQEYDDDDDFMEQVNVYLNASEGSGSDDKALEGILKKSPSAKTVKFAMDDAMFDPHSDQAKSGQELLSKISRLTELLREADEQSTLERDRRKKKEKSLMKLAKELKKRISQQETDKDKMEEVRSRKQVCVS
jgi:hypothetical protein